MSKLTLGDRAVSAAVGAVLGALVGLLLAWLLGVYSQALGPAHQQVDVLRLVGKVSASFAIIGAIAGPSVGTALGDTLTFIYQFERGSENPEVPAWLVVAVLGAVVLGVWWFLRQ